MNEEQMRAFIAAVRKLAWEMPAPNEYTPRFMGMCIAAENAMNARAALAGAP